jgi:hypothetical protein
LISVYPHLLEFFQRHGHANIPLGSAEGRQCATLRRLAVQQKLSPQELDFLEQSVNFRFHSLEDVYGYANFEEMLQKLVAYEAIHHDNYQVPKKYSPDPEFGAWVTGLRRLGPERVQPQHAATLNEIGFSWISKRKCGSKFMQFYRSILERLEDVDDAERREEILQMDNEVQKWLQAQREARKRGTLSETRAGYLTNLFGKDWMKE